MINKIKKKINHKLDELKYVTAMHNAASLCNAETFGPYKNYFCGKEIAICGAGPSLEYYNPMENVSHIALNRALLNNKIKYEWFIADDWDGIDFIKDELEVYDCIKFFGHQLGSNPKDNRQIPESYRLRCNAKRYYTDSYMKANIWESHFICDIDRMAVSNMPNIALSAMQIALFTNPKCIYIIGCDASKGHYVQPQDLDSERIQTHEKDLKVSVSSNRVIDKWKELKEFADAFYPDTDIVSINPVGLKGIFKDQYQHDIL